MVGATGGTCQEFVSADCFGYRFGYRFGYCSAKGARRESERKTYGRQATRPVVPPLGK
jgi:hypothetical protein